MNHHASLSFALLFVKSSRVLCNPESQVLSSSHFAVTDPVTDPVIDLDSPKMSLKFSDFVALTFGIFNFFPKFLRDRQIEGKCNRIKQKLCQSAQKCKS